MKSEICIRSFIKYSTLSAIALSGTIYAIERPSPAAQPEEKVAVKTKVNDNQALPMPQVDVQDIAYLGVFGVPISDVLSAHLNLAKDIGMELQVVANNSPASKAGLKQQDIITSLDGKDISSLEDLQAVIATKKPGDEVVINFISKGKASSKNITLGARSVARAERADAKQLPMPKQGRPGRNQEPRDELGDMSLPKDFLEKFPANDREKLMRLFKGKLEGLDLQELQKGMDKMEGFDFNLLPQGLGLGLDLNPEINKGLKIRGGFHGRIKMVDGLGSITLETTKDGKVIELLDKAGKLQYRGPYNNEADKMSVPEDLRERVKNLNIDSGLRILGKPKMNNQDGDNLKLNFKNLRGLNDMPKLQDMEKELLKQLPKLPKALRKQLEIPDNFKQLRLPELRNGNAAKLFNFNMEGNNFSSTLTDPQTGNRYTLKTVDKKKQVEVYDPNGKLLYDGPYNSDIERASVPDEYRDFINKLEKRNPVIRGNKLKFQLGQ